MKISVLQEDLLWAISLAARFVSTKPQLPILANILLKTEEGKLKISATNLETGISLSAAAKIEKEGELTVPAKIFADLIANLPAGKIEISEEKDNLIVSTSSFSARIAGIASSEFPSVPKKIREKHFSIPRKTLNILTKQVCFAASGDEARPVLTGINLVFGGSGLAVATDGFRMSVRQLSSEDFSLGNKPGKNSVLIPARTIEELNKALGSGVNPIDIEVQEKEGQVIFESDDVVLTSRIINGEFPDHERIIPKETPLTLEVSKEELTRAIKAVAVFARESASIVKMIVGKELKISAESSVYGGESVDVAARIEGEGFEIAFNYKFLLDFLNAITGDTVLIKLKNSTSAGLFQDAKEENLQHVIMPVRV